MKVVFGLLVLGGIAIAVVYYSGVSSFDPTEQGNRARSAIHPGMTWKEVVETAGAPKRFQTFVPRKKGEVEFLEPSIAMKFEKEMFARQQAAGDFKYGFIFPYRFSNSVAFDVVFDAKGVVKAVGDKATMADLLSGDASSGIGLGVNMGDEP